MTPRKQTLNKNKTRKEKKKAKEELLILSHFHLIELLRYTRGERDI